MICFIHFIHLRKSLLSKRGATAVEFSIIGMIFILLIIGTIEFSRALWIHNTLQYITEESGRFAVVNQDASDEALTTYAQSKASEASLDTVSIIIQHETVNNTDYVSIRATYQFSFLTTLIPSGPISLSGSTRVPLLE